MENPRNRKFRIINEWPVVEASASHVITRSKGKQIAKEEEEGSRKDALEVSLPTKDQNDEMEVDNKEMEADGEIDTNNKEKEKEEAEGKGKEKGQMSDNGREKWLTIYQKDLVFPEGGIQDYLIIGVKRVFDRVEFKFDNYENVIPVSRVEG